MRIDELKVVYLLQEEGIGLYLQIDKRAHGLVGMLASNWDLYERHVSVLIPKGQITYPRRGGFQAGQHHYE